MAWLARLDTRAERWSSLWRGLYLLIKWSLVALGAFAWVMLWWQRGPLLGISQGALLIVLSLRRYGLL